MAGIELGARHRAGREGARITFADGSVVQLGPFASIRFETSPVRIEGRLLRVRRGVARFETPALMPHETKR